MESALIAIGTLLIVGALLDAFQTIILPRRATGRVRLTSIFYGATWRPWRSVACRIGGSPRRESFLSYYGPLSLILLLVLWASVVVLGFGLVFYGLGSPFRDSGDRSLRSDIYMSGTTLFTLGLGDVTPSKTVARELVVLEAGTGLAFLAVVMGYFPVLYGAFSRREVTISLLDARAGSPPSAAELLRRHAFEGGAEALTLLLEEWERWSAELLESHISYPLFCYFRSQHTNQSWLSALVAILDTCSLLIAGVEGQPSRQAQLTFAMARHALVDLALIFHRKPVTEMPDRLPEESFGELYRFLCAARISVFRDAASVERLTTLRSLYEGHAEAMSRYLEMPLPPWLNDSLRKDNWQIVAKVRADAEAGAGGAGESGAAESDAEAARRMALLVSQHHDF